MSWFNALLIASNGTDSLLQREKTKQRGIKGKQKNAGWDHGYLLKLVGIPI